jgi:hypothetical protein
MLLGTLALGSSNKKNGLMYLSNFLQTRAFFKIYFFVGFDFSSAEKFSEDEDEDYGEVKEYFTPQQWRRMPPIERLRQKNCYIRHTQLNEICKT